MIITTDDKGKETKYTYSQCKKIFAEKQRKFLHKKIIEALKKNLGELSNSGHEILSPSYYITKIGLPDEFVCGLAFKHKSDYSDHKSTLYDNNGGVADYIFGVNNLSMLERLCGIVGWDKKLYQCYVDISGRGRLGGICYENLAKQLNYQFKKE